MTDESGTNRAGTSPPRSSSGSGAEITDGRRVKGERRRRTIVDATLRVIERDGVGAVTHRNVAREADVPPASIAYYFATIDELLVATLLDSADALIEELRRLADSVGDDDGRWAEATARLLAEMVNEHRGRTIAEYELYLLAARRPALRPAARRWIQVAAGCVGEAASDSGVLHAYFAAIDGLLMQALIADGPLTAEHFEPVLSYVAQPVRYLQKVGALREQLGA